MLAIAALNMFAKYEEIYPPDLQAIITDYESYNGLISKEDV